MLIKIYKTDKKTKAKKLYYISRYDVWKRREEMNDITAIRVTPSEKISQMFCLIIICNFNFAAMRHT